MEKKPWDETLNEWINHPEKWLHHPEGEQMPDHDSLCSAVYNLSRERALDEVVEMVEKLNKEREEYEDDSDEPVFADDFAGTVLMGLRALKSPSSKTEE